MRLDRDLLQQLNFSGVVITAKIGQGGALEPVAGLPEKLQAARQRSLSHIHTVVVAEGQRGEIQRRAPHLLDDNPPADFRVICAATLADAVRAVVVDGQARWGAIVDYTPELGRHSPLVGRAWLREQVQRFIESHESGYLLLIGGAGVGKSAFIADMLCRSQGTQAPVAFHFIKRDMGGWDQPEVIFPSVAAQLRRTCLLPVTETEQQMSLMRVFFSVLQRVSQWLAAQGKAKKAVIYLDGLDAAFAASGNAAWETLLAMLPAVLPSGIIIVLTSRPGECLNQIIERMGCASMSLDPTALDNLHDIRTYLKHQNQEGDLRLRHDSLEQLVQGTKGVFGDVVTAMQMSPASRDRWLRERQREAVLWRWAYTFLRLDQLPSGGWGKTLPQWMEALWEGDNGSITRHPTMRTKGGSDLTTYAFFHYSQFLQSHLQTNDLRQVIHNGVADQVCNNLIAHTKDGEVNKQVERRAPGSIRHTLMGMLLLLTFGELKQHVLPLEVLNEISRYLTQNLQEWKHDTAHLFGMFAAHMKVLEMLRQEACVFQAEPCLVEQLTHVSQLMMTALREPTDRSRFRPEMTFRQAAGVEPFFQPYAGFWRMTRSNLVMYLPFLTDGTGSELHPGLMGTARLATALRQRCAQCLEEMLQDIRVPCEEADPTASLVRYHHDPNTGRHVKRDWGLSAELAAVLALPAVQSLITSHTQMAQGELEKKQEALHSALKLSFDTYHPEAEIFHFTHGVSFSRYLQLAERGSIAAQDLKNLDVALTRLTTKGVTEKSLEDFLRDEVLLPAGNPQDINVPALINLLLDKLEPGEYISALDPDTWQQQVRIAQRQSFLFHEMDPLYPISYGQPRTALVALLDHITGLTTYEGKRALDVGCGPGQYAQLLQSKGFKVELFDASDRMLEMASQKLGIEKPKQRDLYRLASYKENDQDPPQSFFLIFACAILVHVPQNQAHDVLHNFYDLLEHDGVLMVNFKIGDHSLISKDGRYFQYYRQKEIPEGMIKGAGFDIINTFEDTNKRNMYGEPKRIKWVNFYCKKA